MSHYITRWCEVHGEWEMDSDNSGPCPQCPVCPTCEGLGIVLPHMQVAHATHAATVAEYEAKLAVLEADRERLDFLICQAHDYGHVSAMTAEDGEIQWQSGTRGNLFGTSRLQWFKTDREAIDAARTTSPEANNDR